MTLPDRDAAGNLPAASWPGLYPLYYVTRRGLLICPACASRACDDEPVEMDVNWTHPTLTCEDCGAAIPSAYGDDA